ncbi:glycosyltransferase family 4 protein [Paenibacillus naphthalenovorans]|uniref:Family 1 glycosyl transferase n=1 Tax=Paenibacillus naphthalenovorans TaxID=162209 RepID=A0A0U2M7K4_9BACL|nr:glycosyltransferase family 4 protein [Paenibacillus naphthalenovorans]ALS24160.1 family 1 glycosyl transferase [Paenibacillus naphthalenovorans]SDJ84749.1 Glycosyltransferase involved in cell wall bisynthesis [Paenibacillus naphthalenovorans]
MKIWIFNHYAIAPGTSGITRHYDLAKELVKLGCDVTIFASSFDHQMRKEIHIHDDKTNALTEEYSGVRFVWVKTPPYQKNDFRRVKNMIAYTIRAYREAMNSDVRPDVCIGSLMHPLAALLGYFVASKKKSKYFFEERDLWPQSLIDLGKVSEKNPIVWLLSKLEMFLFRKADKIVILFDKAKGYIEQKGIDSKKIIYLPNGADIERYGNDIEPVELTDELNQTFSSLKGKFIAVYTGTIGVANNLDAVLDAASILKNQGFNEIHFLLIGNGAEKSRLEKRKVNEELDNVTFLPPVRKEIIPTILSKVNVGLLPLQDSPIFKWGISPNKMFDYMAASIPTILLCDLEGTPLEKAEGGSIIKNNFGDNLAKQLIFYASDKEHTKLVGIKARRYVEKHHTWSKLSKDFYQVIKENIT